MSIGSRIKERRESLEMTQTQLAEALGVTKGAIGNYETDANSPKASMLYKIVEILQCDVNYLFQDYYSNKDHIYLSIEEKKIVLAYRGASPDDRTIVKSALKKYMPGQEATTPDIEAEVAEYRRQLLLEKSNQDRFFVSKDIADSEKTG